MPPFVIEHLDEKTLLDAWPLLRSAGTEPLPGWWENEALALIGRGGGVIAARAPDGSIHGIATYEAVHRPRSGPLLAVGRLVTFELSRKEPAKAALGAALQMIACAFSCAAVALPLRARSYAWQRERADQSGHRPAAGLKS